MGARLRKEGSEFGATTGRPRRCGWLDLVALRYTAMINGFTELAVTKLDVLSGLDELKVCTRYRVGGKETTRFPSEVQTLDRVEPVYETVPGWTEDISGVRHFADLPSAAQDYLGFVADTTGVRVGLISNGPKRSQIISDMEQVSA